MGFFDIRLGDIRCSIYFIDIKNNRESYLEQPGLVDQGFTLDLPSFFEFYKIINAKALSQQIGMNQSLLAQFITGKKRPSPTQTRRILNGVQQIGTELSEIRFLL